MSSSCVLKCRTDSSLSCRDASLIHERTSAGRAAAKAKGVRFGRPPALSAEQIAHARQLINGDMKPAEVARLLGVHRATLYRALDGASAED